MFVTIPAFNNGSPIPEQYAFCRIDVKNHKAPGGNKNPEIIWSELPEGTKSLVLICVDDKVPSVFTDANKESVTIPKDLPRMDFYHWLVVDIDPSLGKIQEGEDSNAYNASGKKAGKQAYGVTGINSYGETHGGYDGPCPPWNDELIHEYHFRLYALDIPTLNLSGGFTGPQVFQAMEGHVLASAEWLGTYTLNPSLRKNS